MSSIATYDASLRHANIIPFILSGMFFMFKPLLISVFVLSLGGCATITRGANDQFQIRSEPTGAAARTSLGQTCVTPCTLQVGRKDEFTVTVSHPGYAEQSVDVKTQLAGSGAAGFAGNALVGGLIGMGVDAATGATLDHVPNPVSVVLVRQVAETARRRSKAAKPRKPAVDAPAPEPAPQS